MIKCLDCVADCCSNGPQIFHAFLNPHQVTPSHTYCDSLSWRAFVNEILTNMDNQILAMWMYSTILEPFDSHMVWSGLASSGRAHSEQRHTILAAPFPKNSSLIWELTADNKPNWDQQKNQLSPAQITEPQNWIINFVEFVLQQKPTETEIGTMI